MQYKVFRCGEISSAKYGLFKVTVHRVLRFLPVQNVKLGCLEHKRN